MRAMIIAMMDVAVEEVSWDEDFMQDGTIEDIEEKLMDLSKMDMLVPTTDTVRTLASLIDEWKLMHKIVRV